MILTGKQIKKEISLGNIVIEPYREESIQPNSHDYHLGNELIVYSSNNIDSKGIANEEVQKIIIPESGYTIRKGELYLGITEEITSTQLYSQLIFGDKSVGSLGIWTQITAPLAHIGSKIRWTLEIRCIKDVVIYPGMRFGKICFLVNDGEIIKYGDERFHNSGRYLKNEITHSLIDKDILN